MIFTVEQRKAVSPTDHIFNLISFVFVVDGLRRGRNILGGEENKEEEDGIKRGGEEMRREGREMGEGRK